MEIIKIVVTGGPCGGKSTALDRIKSEFEEKGYVVLTIPETATELINGGVAPWTCGSKKEYQRGQVRLQVTKERVYEYAASTMNADKILIVCDRGVLDSKAYMMWDDFTECLELAGETEEGIMSTYGAIFHLVTAAKGAEAYYTTANNAARTETVEEAVAVDDRIIEAWQNHPNFVSVDNSTDFNRKMDRLIEAIEHFLDSRN